MRLKQVLVVAAVASIVPFILGQGCPTSGGPAQLGLSDLTALERQAIVAACLTPGGLGQATDVARNATGDLLDGGILQSLPSDSEEPAARDVSFGTCPAVTKSGSIGDGTAVQLSINFGSQPCQALPEIADSTYTCSGQASGSFDLTSKAISLSFQNISCNQKTLNGTASVTFDLVRPGVALEGQWDLTWNPGQQLIVTNGTAAVSHALVSGGCCDTVTIGQFIGTASNNGYQWSMTMTDVLISLERYASLIPYSGTVVVDNDVIRPLTITFNENSPTTEQVSVQINGGRAFTVTLSQLAEWAAILFGS